MQYRFQKKHNNNHLVFRDFTGKFVNKLDYTRIKVISREEIILIQLFSSNAFLFSFGVHRFIIMIAFIIVASFNYDDIVFVVTSFNNLLKIKFNI